MLPFFALSGAPHAGKPLKNSSNKNENVTRKGARKSRLQTQKKKKKKKKKEPAPPPDTPFPFFLTPSPLPPRQVASYFSYPSSISFSAFSATLWL